MKPHVGVFKQRRLFANIIYSGCFQTPGKNVLQTYKKLLKPSPALDGSEIQLLSSDIMKNTSCKPRDLLPIHLKPISCIETLMLATPKFGGLERGHDKPRRSWEWLAIYPFQLSHEKKKKNLLLSMKSWLVNRDPYFMVYEIIPYKTWVGNFIPYINPTNQRPFFFIAQLSATDFSG